MQLVSNYINLTLNIFYAFRETKKHRSIMSYLLYFSDDAFKLSFKFQENLKDGANDEGCCKNTGLSYLHIRHVGKS